MKKRNTDVGNDGKVPARTHRFSLRGLRIERTYLMTSHGNSAVSMAFCTHEETVKRRDRGGCRTRMTLRHTGSIPSQGRVQWDYFVLIYHRLVSQAERRRPCLSKRRRRRARHGWLLSETKRKDVQTLTMGALHTALRPAFANALCSGSVLLNRNFDPETRTLKKHTQNGGLTQDTVERDVEGMAEKIIAEDEQRRAQELVGGDTR